MKFFLKNDEAEIMTMSGWLNLVNTCSNYIIITFQNWDWTGTEMERDGNRFGMGLRQNLFLSYFL